MDLNLDLLRDQYSLETKKGLGFILAATIFWTLMILVGFFENNTLRIICYFAGGATIFPLGLLISKLLNALEYTDKSLGALGAILNLIQILFFPLVWGAIFYKIEALPWFLAVISGAHLLPYGWLYRSKTYIFSAIVIAIGSAIIGIRFVSLTYIIIPIFQAVLFLGTSFLLGLELEKLKKTQHKIAT